MYTKIGDFFTPSPLYKLAADLHLPYFINISMTPFLPPMRTHFMDSPQPDVVVEDSRRRQIGQKSASRALLSYHMNGKCPSGLCRLTPPPI